MLKITLGISICLIAVLLVACSHGSVPMVLTLPNAVHLAEDGQGYGRVGFRVKVPRKRLQPSAPQYRVHPAYVSPDAKGMILAITGPTTTNVTLGLTALSRNCTSRLAQTVCAITVRLKSCPNARKECYNAEITTYDAYNSTKNTVPPNANQLSIDRLTFNVKPGQDTPLSCTLSGVPGTAYDRSGDTQ